MSAPAPDRLESVLAQLEELHDIRVRELAREAVRAVLELHAAGLAQALKIVGAAAGKGPAVVEALAGDPLVGNLLLLHGLHPHEVEERVRAGLARVAPQLQKHGAEAHLEGLEGGVAQVRLEAGKVCQGTQRQLRTAIEAALVDAASDLVGVEFVTPSPPGAFVPLARLHAKRTASGELP